MSAPFTYSVTNRTHLRTHTSAPCVFVFFILFFFLSLPLAFFLPRYFYRSRAIFFFRTPLLIVSCFEATAQKTEQNKCRELLAGTTFPFFFFLLPFFTVVRTPVNLVASIW